MTTPKDDTPKIRVPKNKNSDYLMKRLKFFDENEALLKAKENAKNRARILLPRALRIIAMEIEGFAREVPSKRQLFRAVKEKIDLEMQNYLTESEKRKQIKIRSFFDALHRFTIFFTIAIVTYFIFFYLMEIDL